jgi:hypothetical protein
MSKMSDLHLTIVEELNRGQLAWSEIAYKLNIPLVWVELVNDEVNSSLEELNTLDDSMDGDFDSAMTSAGYGTDEDYGYFGGDE